MRLTIRGAAPAMLGLCCALMLMAPASAPATTSAKQLKSVKAAGVGYFRSIQETDGAFPGFDNDWALGALAAAGTAAADMKQTGGSADARTFYRQLFGEPTTWPGGSEPAVTEFERAALNIYAAGVDPARVSVRQNLIAQIVARWQPSAPGYYGSPTNFGGALFGLLALAEARTRSGHQRVPQALLAPSIAVLRANQHNDGGWTIERAEGNPTKLAPPSEPDETGAAIAALCAAGVPSGDPAITAAVNYLKSDLVSATGAFKAPFGDNTDSNAWGVQGLDACSVDPQGNAFTTAAGKTPVDYLVAGQVSGGGFAFEPGETTASEYSSQDALRAISGGSFTAKPAGTKNGPRWLFASAFEGGLQSSLALVIDDGSDPVRVCSVAIAPSGATTTLARVLEAGESSATPAGCVTSFLPSSGNGAITQLNGSPSTAEARWTISVDGARAKPAKRAGKIALGDTILLHQQ